jgi:small conductance mechanosensitive channel
MEEATRNAWVTTAILVGAGVLLYAVLIGLGARFVGRVGAMTPGAAPRIATLWVMVRRVLFVVIVVLALLMVLDVWQLSLAPFLAVGTAVGAAVGFGAQNLIRDLIAGFFILAEDQYRIGDNVTIAATNGKVEDIQFRVTVLRDLEGNVHYVPNGQITVTTNFTSLYAQPVVDVRVGYKADLDAAMTVMLDELMRLAADPEWSDRITKEPEMLGVQELVGSGVLIQARITTVADQRWSVRREALRRVRNRFASEEIEIL